MDSWVLFWLVCLGVAFLALIIAIIKKQRLEKRYYNGELQDDLDNIRFTHRKHADWVIEHAQRCSCDMDPDNENCLYPERNHDKR